MFVCLLTWATPRMPLVENKLPTPPGHMSFTLEYELPYPSRTHEFYPGVWIALSIQGIWVLHWSMNCPTPPGHMSFTLEYESPTPPGHMSFTLEYELPYPSRAHEFYPGEWIALPLQGTWVLPWSMNCPTPPGYSPLVAFVVLLMLKDKRTLNFKYKMITDMFHLFACFCCFNCYLFLCCVCRSKAH
jgi:hypothetical protein